MKNILIAIDFEEKTSKLVDEAALLAKSFDSKIWILHIDTQNLDYFGTPDNFQFGMQYINVEDDKKKQKSEELKKVQAYVDQMKNQGIDAEGILVEGPTVKMILDEAQKLNIDLIVIGSHKHSFLYNALLENVSATLLKKSNIPLLVVPLN
jgi:nucleotide-binding universal stress UspA family protein